MKASAHKFNFINCFFLLLVIHACKNPSESLPIKENAVYERVQKDKILRAAYTPFQAGFIKDYKNGEISGIFPSILSEICKRLGWELKWTEEVSWDFQEYGLITGKFDIVGSPVWPTSQRQEHSTFTNPVYYNEFGFYVRENENRFDKNLSLINSHGITIGTVDGHISKLIANEYYPKASKYSLPETLITDQLFVLMQAKCDIVILDTYDASMLFKYNNFHVKRITAKLPVMQLANCFMFKNKEPRLKKNIDSILAEFIKTGYVNEIIKKYNPNNLFFYRVDSLPSSTQNLNY